MPKMIISYLKFLLDCIQSLLQVERYRKENDAASKDGTLLYTIILTSLILSYLLIAR